MFPDFRFSQIVTVFCLFSDPLDVGLRSASQEDHQQAGSQSQDFEQGKNYGRTTHFFVNSYFQNGPMFFHIFTEIGYNNKLQ